MLSVSNCYGAVVFNGDADRVVFTSNALDQINTFTLAILIKPNTIGINDIIFYKGSSVNTFKRLNYGSATASRVRGFVNAGTWADSSAESEFIATGNWYWLFMTYDDAGDRYVRIYKSLYSGGSFGSITEASYSAQTQGAGAIIDDSSGDWSIACQVQNGNPNNMTSSEAYIYSKILTPTEMTIIAKSQISGIGTQFSNCILHVSLNDNPIQTGINGLTFTDLSGNGNNGTGVDSDGDSSIIGEGLLSSPPQPLMW